MRRSARAAAVAPVACVALVTGIVGELNGPAESGDTNRAPAVGAVGGERVPVYDSPEARWTVGTIQGTPGSVACQDQFLFEPYDAHGRVSDWWVQARADNGRWGWAPAVALADIVDWAPVPGLRRCGTGPTLLPGSGALRPE